MSRFFAIAMCGWLAVGCRKEVSSTLDAGAPLNRSMDLRTALTLIFPEWRGAQVIDGHASVIRKLKPVPKEWKRDSEVALKANQFRVSESAKGQGGAKDSEALQGIREPFDVVIGVAGDVLQQVANIPLSADDVSRIFQSPAPLSSEQLAMWLPRFPNSQLSEEFSLSLHYRAVPRRADFLVRQLVDFNTASLWKVMKLPDGWNEKTADGGHGNVPENFILEMVEKDSGASIEVKKEGDDVWLTYLLPTR